MLGFIPIDRTHCVLIAFAKLTWWSLAAEQKFSLPTKMRRDGFCFKNNRLTRVGVPAATGQDTTILCNTLKTHGIAEIKAFSGVYRRIFCFKTDSILCGVKGMIDLINKRKHYCGQQCCQIRFLLLWPVTLCLLEDFS